jgi:hypothetical protein
MALPVESDTLQTIVGSVAVFAVLVAVTDATVRSFAPVLALSAGLVAYEVADDAYDLPKGTNWTVYGLGLCAAGAVLGFAHTRWAGGAVALAGAWFVLDGVTTVRYGPARTPHEFVSGPEDEAMYRLRVMNDLTRTLRDASEPRGVAELAESCDCTESLVESALEYLKQRGQVVHTETGYRATSQAWGRANAIRRLLRWIPRRVLRPFRRVFADA